MTVINGCTALNELQADRGTRKCTQKASQTTHSDRHTHTHTHHSELQRASFACRSMLFWSYDEMQHRNELLFQLLHLALNGHTYLFSCFKDYRIYKLEGTPCNHMQQLNIRTMSVVASLCCSQLHAAVANRTFCTNCSKHEIKRNKFCWHLQIHAY